MALSNTGDDANLYVDALKPQVVEDVAADVCATIGIDYEGPPDMPRRKSDGRAAPWAGKGQVRSKGG